MRKLTPKQQKFVEEYLLDLNASRAYRAAGYAPKDADVNSAKLMVKDSIAAAIQKKMDARSKRTEITSDRVLQELAKLGFGNTQNLYDDEGRLLHIHEMPEEVAATIQEVTEETLYGKGKKKGDDDESEVVRRKYKVADKKASLELLGKHLKLFTDKIEQETSLTITRKTYGT